MVRSGFPQLWAHRVLWAFVVTWERVPGHAPNPSRNTYQAIIATNGLYSFTIFLYNQLEWSAGAWGSYPQVGFNAGDEVNYFTLEKSFTADVITVVHDSNIGVPGQFIFMTNGLISEVRCNSSGGLQSSPFRGSMHGGYPLRLFGICFHESSIIVEINGKRINNCRSTLVSVECTMPMVSEGRMQIRVFESGNLIGQSEFLSFMPETNANVILSNHGALDYSYALREDTHVNLYFLTNALTTNNFFRLVVYDYSAQYIVRNNTFYNIDTNRVDLPSPPLNLSAMSNLTIRFSSIFPPTGEPIDRVHLLDITFELIASNTTSQTNSWKGARQFTVRLFVMPYLVTFNYCQPWSALQSDLNTINLANAVPGCPCRVRTTWDEEQLGFSADPACDGRKSGMFNCRLHQGARGCYRRKSTTSDGAAHCCYNNNGGLITDRKLGGGSLIAHYPETLKALSTFRYFFMDRLPYASCCGVGTEMLSTCAQYIRYRRPRSACINFNLETGVVNNDPHFSTLDGNFYTFNGHGEYTLLKSIDKQFEIQVRLTQLRNESANSASIQSMENATAITAFVIRNEDQPRVQFELFPKLRLIEIRVDEKLLEFTPLSEPDELLSSSLIYGDDRQLIIRQTDVNSYSISYGESGIQFIVDVRPQFDFLNLISIMPSKFKENLKFQGILGGFEGLAYANGTSLSTNLNDDKAMFHYGESWRTTSNSSLFHYLFQDNHAQHQDLTYRPTFQQDLFNMHANTSRYQIAKNVCHNIDREEQCIYDVLITNDATIVQMYKNSETYLTDLNEYIMLVTVDIENGTMPIVNDETTTMENIDVTSIGLDETTTTRNDQTTTTRSDQTTTTRNDQTTTTRSDSTTTTRNDQTTTTRSDQTTTTRNDQTTTARSDLTTTTRNDQTTTTRNDDTTEMTPNSATNYALTELWMIAILALIVLIH
ncbi:unnamed protein product [Rotaria sp. Silwood2]|nr:unnamed protein product [Rotaria sp. Silwood2]CAF4294596.1 unnamed protein product [Rotaria sp. Silwood2]